MPLNYAKNFSGGRLEQVLSIRGFSQSTFAAHIGVSEGTLSKWIDGLQSPTFGLVKQMSLILNVKPDFFMMPFCTGLGVVHFRRRSKALRKKCNALTREME